MSEKANSYDDIQVISSREAIRRRPGMYLGALNTRAILHLWSEYLFEICNNHLAGEIHIHWTQKGSHSFILEVNSTTPMPRMREYNEDEVHLRTANGFTYESFCALSERMTVEVEGFQVNFEEGIRKGEPDFETPKQISHLRMECELDRSIFTQLAPQFGMACTILESISLQFPHLRLTLTDTTEAVLQQRFFHSPKGIISLLERMQGEAWTKADWCFEFAIEKEGVQWNAGIIHQPDRMGNRKPPNQTVIINGAEAQLGKTLKKAIFRGLQKGINSYRKQNNLSKAKLDEKSILIAIAAKIEHPQWLGPTRTKLDMPHLKPLLEEGISAHFAQFLENNPKVSGIYQLS